MVIIKLSNPRPTGEVLVTITTDGPDHEVANVEKYLVPEDNVISDLKDQGHKLGERIGERMWILLDAD